jgi:hypothetical protein
VFLLSNLIFPSRNCFATQKVKTREYRRFDILDFGVMIKVVRAHVSGGTSCRMLSHDQQIKDKRLSDFPRPISYVDMLVDCSCKEWILQ